MSFTPVLYLLWQKKKSAVKKPGSSVSAICSQKALTNIVSHNTLTSPLVAYPGRNHCQKMWCATVQMCAWSFARDNVSPTGSGVSRNRWVMCVSVTGYAARAAVLYVQRLPPGPHYTVLGSAGCCKVDCWEPRASAAPRVSILREHARESGVCFA